MYNALPLTMIFSLLLWVSAAFTLLGCAQLILIDSAAKRENPKARSYSQMSEENKKGIRKAAIKITIGLTVLISLALADRYFII